MFEALLDKMRKKIHSRQYIMILHAEEEMEDDGLTIFDVESIILTGSIIERQKDAITAESKYLIRGKSLKNLDAIVVGKLSLTGKLVILTVYRL
jgi:hypothetical protein